MYKNWIETLQQYMDAHENELVEDTMKLVRIASVRAPAEAGKPFGSGAAEAVSTAETLMQKYGFTAHNYKNYAVAADLTDKERELDIWAHLDVVPAGDGWTITQPFVPIVKNGNIYGRGTADDKGPAMAALYAMRAIRELKFPVSRNCRLILGSDEESGSSDMVFYYQREPEAPMTISPDGTFPVVNIEKGGLHSGFYLTLPAQHGAVQLKQLQAGTVINAVPGRAEAVISGVEPVAVLQEAHKDTGAVFTMVKESDSSIRIVAEGTSAHASSPEEGNNALTALLYALAHISFDSAAVNKTLRALTTLFPHGDYYGSALGVDHEDEKSGKLTLTLSIMHFDGTELQGRFDCRAPLCANEENTNEVIKRKLQDHGFTPEQKSMYAAHYVDEHSRLVSGLLWCYEAVTGESARPLAIGGGSYVHEIKNGVIFGCGAPGVSNNMHGPDEFISIAQLKKSAVLIALAILKLCNEERESNL